MDHKNCTDLADTWELDRTVAYINHWGFKEVALQFPDSALRDAPLIAAELQDKLSRVCNAKVYVMADTTYNPLTVDEVAAQHINADCVVSYRVQEHQQHATASPLVINQAHSLPLRVQIHYGQASLSPVSHIPALCVLPKADADVQQTCELIIQHLQSAVATACTSAVLLLDQMYLHIQQQLQGAVTAAYEVCIFLPMT
jgi:diphthamide biosynthesis protein 2